jgi:hypothetical protein
VIAAWYDWRDTPDAFCGAYSLTYAATSVNGGASWQAGRPVADAFTAWSLVNSNQVPNQGDYLGLWAGGERAWLAWADGRDGDPDVYSATLDVADQPLPASRTRPLALDGPWPNPVSGPIALRVSLPTAAPARVELLDPAGRLRRSVEVVPRAAGWQWVELGNCDGLEPGLYFIRGRQGRTSATRRLAVLR